MSIKLDRESLTARFVEALQPFPFREDTMAPEKDLACITQMSLHELDDAHVKSHEVSLAVDCIGATSSVITRDDIVSRRIPFFDHSQATAGYAHTFAQAAQ